MKFILPEKRIVKTLVLFVFAALLFSADLQAQSRKSKPTSKAVAKKTAKTGKDAPKSSKKEQLAKKSSKKDSRKERETAKSRNSKRDREQARRDSRKDSKKEKLSAKEKSRDKDKKDKKMSAKERRAESARKKAEEARRQAAIAAQRRREELARIARERKIAFERGLRTQTAENIQRDNTEGEDLAVRAAAVDALGSRAGTVVVMEAKTGKIVTMVNQDWAIKNSFKPCSTIKLVTGVAGISESVINGEGGIGSSTSGQDLDFALARSSNGYFQRVGSNFGNKKMIEYSKDLGLGEKTGINADGETPGKLPHGNNNARIYSHGDDFEVTPLQLAVMVSAISNDGKKVVPQVTRKSSSFKPKFRDSVDLPYKTVQGVIPGMIGAAEYGTARRGVEQGQGVAGKTGSCIFKGSWIGLFASVAPVEDPQYSVVVITRGESERGKYAAAIAGNVYRSLASRLRRNHERYTALKNIRPQPAPDNVASADEAEEEEDEAEVAADTAAPKQIVVGSAPREDAPKKLIQKTTQSKPVNFPKVVIQYDKEKAAKQERPRVVKN
jgi:penicillin-binding protein 2